MQKINLEGLNEYVSYEKLDNNLDVYVYRKKDFHSFYAYYITNYGALNTEFVPINEEKMHKFPDGIAHFLEHKMFEKEDGHVLEKFPLIGGSSNAFTSYTHTVYQVSGTEKFYDNLNLLINFVENPYFTDKNVEKEKGIIKQELFMGKDNPYRVFAFEKLKNLFVNLGYGREIVGEEKDIDSITKEDLYKCYNTFYNPSNMFVVITGKVDKDKVFQIIEENQNNKTFEKMKKIDVKIYDEPDEVFKEKEVLKMNVTIPKISLNYKFNLNDLPDHLSEKEKMMYLSLIFDINFGPTSLFNEQLKQMEIINSNIEISSVEACNHVVYTLFLETESKEKAIELVSNEINKLSINEEQLERKKKGIISSNVFMSDNIFSINHKIMSDIVRYNHVITNIHSIAKSLNIKDAKNVLKKLKFNNYSIFIVDKK